MAQTKTLLSIQYLRGAAALAVVVFHILQWLRGGFETGRAGVDVFFVISGFIIWRVTADRRDSPSAFLWRRFTRVAPAYWVASVLLAAIVIFWPAFLPKVRPQLSHLFLSLAFIPHFDPAGLPFPLLAPGWTLTYEAAFYVIFAACLPAPGPPRAFLVTAGLCAIVAAGLFLSDPAYVLLANPLLLEFVCGLWLAVAVGANRVPGRAVSAGLLVGGLGALAAFALTGWRDELWRALAWGLPATMIVAGAVGLDVGGAVLRWRFFEALGDSSYSIYLFHPIAVAAVAQLVGTRRPWLFIPLALATALVAGFAGRAVVERPFLTLLRNTRHRFSLSTP
ncbi:MAG: acyltransferase family protein [Caulobacteraceae bacterium]